MDSIPYILPKRNITNITNTNKATVYQHNAKLYLVWYFRDIFVVFPWYFREFSWCFREFSWHIPTKRPQIQLIKCKKWGEWRCLKDERRASQGRDRRVSAMRLGCLTAETLTARCWDTNVSPLRHNCGCSLTVLTDKPGCMCNRGGKEQAGQARSPQHLNTAAFILQI